MAKVINVKIDDGILIFTFTNNEDEVFSSFKLNPTDINVAARAEELAEYFEKELGYVQPSRTPFVGSNFNVTRAGIHADGLLKKWLN